MSKKSMRSKGYIGKQKKTAKGYTPEEKRTMIIGFAVIIVVLICVLWLPEALEARHLLKVKDGVVQGIEDNELICNTGTSSNKKYRKLASVEPMEGFALAATEPGISDTNLRYFRYEPTDGEAAAQNYTVQSGNGAASELAANYRQQIGAFSEVLYQDEEIREETINGRQTYSFVLEYRMKDASEATAETKADATEAPADPTDAPEDVAAAGNVALAEEADPTVEPTAEPTAEATVESTAEPAEAPKGDDEEDTVYDYTQAALVYIESPIDGKCVVIQAINTAKDDTVFGDRDALLELALKAAEGVTIVK